MLLDEEEKEARLQERAASARAFKTMREEVVEKRREQDRMDRNASKERQLQEAEEMQACTALSLKQKFYVLHVNDP